MSIPMKDIFNQLPDDRKDRIKKEVVKEICKICENPSDYLENHHIVPESRGGGGGNNIIRICIACHGRAHNVDFKSKSDSVIREGFVRSKNKEDAAKKWMDDNPHLLEEFINKDRCGEEAIFISLLLENNLLYCSEIKNMVLGYPFRITSRKINLKS